MNGEQNSTAPTGLREDQARIELAMAAATAERANKPRGLVIIAGLLVVASLIYAGSGWAARAASLSAVQTERNKTRETEAIVARVNALRNKQVARGLAPEPRVGKAIEELATAAGVKQDTTGRALVVSETEVAGLAVPGVAQKKYRADVKGQDPKALFEWLVNVQSSGETRGVEISMVEIRPDPALPNSTGAGGWSMQIEFVRWESRK